MNEKFLVLRLNGSLNTWAVINSEYEILHTEERECNNVNLRIENLLIEYKKITDEMDIKFGVIKKVIICIPGSIDSKSGKLIKKSRWLSIPEGTNLGELFSSIINKEFYFVNDANASAIGSTIIGEAKDVRSSVYLINSTGVGLGLVINGEIIKGSNNLLGEIGKIEMSGTTIEANLSHRTIIGKSLLISDKDLSTYNDVFDLSKDDERIRELIDDWFKSLLKTIESIMWIYDPDLIEIESELLDNEYFNDKWLKESFSDLSESYGNGNTRIIKTGENSKILPLVGGLKLYLEH